MFNGKVITHLVKVHRPALADWLSHFSIWADVNHSCLWMSDFTLQTHKSLSAEPALHKSPGRRRTLSWLCFWNPADGRWDSSRYPMNRFAHVGSAQRESQERFEPSWLKGTFSGTSAHHGGIGGPQWHHRPSLLTGPSAGYRHYQAWVAHRLPFLIKRWLRITAQQAGRRPDWIRASVYDSVSETTSKDTNSTNKRFLLKNDLLPFVLTLSWFCCVHSELDGFEICLYSILTCMSCASLLLYLELCVFIYRKLPYPKKTTLIWINGAAPVSAALGSERRPSSSFCILSSHFHSVSGHRHHVLFGHVDPEGSHVHRYDIQQVCFGHRAHPFFPNTALAVGMVQAASLVCQVVMLWCKICSKLLKIKL